MQRTLIDPRAQSISPDAELAAGRRSRRLHRHRARACSIGRRHARSGRTSSSTARHASASGNHIFQFASIGDAPQDKKYAGEPTRLEIGDRNMFREFVHDQPRHGAGPGRHADRQRQPVHGVHARRARLHRRQPLRHRQLRDARRATCELGDWVILGGFCRRPPVLQGRRARLHREQRRSHARRAALRDGGRASRRSRTGVNCEGLKRRGFERRRRSRTSARPSGCCTAPD